MINQALFGVGNVLPSGATLKLSWTEGGAGGTNVLHSGVANISYTAAIPIDDAEQLGILIFPAGTSGAGSDEISVPVVARLQWSVDGDLFVEEKLEQPAAVSGGVQQFSAVIKEWGPNTLAWPIWRPACACYFKLGLYATGDPAATDTVTVFVLLQQPGQLQASGG